MTKLNGLSDDCDDTEVKGTCKLVYRVVKVRPDINAKVKDPVSGNQVNGCQWTSLDADPKKVKWDCSLSGVTTVPDIVPYMTINKAPIICDA
jgi:hypothetical protein